MVTTAFARPRPAAHHPQPTRLPPWSMSRSTIRARVSHSA